MQRSAHNSLRLSQQFPVPNPSPLVSVVLIALQRLQVISRVHHFKARVKTRAIFVISFTLLTTSPAHRMHDNSNYKLDYNLLEKNSVLNFKAKMLTFCYQNVLWPEKSYSKYLGRYVQY